MTGESIFARRLESNGKYAFGIARRLFLRSKRSRGHARARFIRACPPLGIPRRREREFFLSLFFRSSSSSLDDESYELQTRSRKTEHRDGRGKTSNHRTLHICAYSQLTSVFLDHNRAGRVFILDSLKREGID